MIFLRHFILKCGIIPGSGACPECQVPLRRANFRLQLFEDASIDKEVDIRRRILRDFNQKEEDFDSLAEYKEKHREQIARNRHRVSKAELELESIVLEEGKKESHWHKVKKEEEEMRKKRQQDKEALIDDLMFSDADAKDIVSQHKAAAEAAVKAKEEAERQANASTTFEYIVVLRSFCWRSRSFLSCHVTHVTRLKIKKDCWLLY